MSSVVDREWKITPRGVGLPDYSTPAPIGSTAQGVVYTSPDPGESAARLGSPVKYDRRGNVVFMTDFQASINPFTFAIGAGAGALAEQSAEISQSGGSSLKMCSGIATTTSLTWIGSMVGMSKLGLTISLCSPDTNFTQIVGNILIYDGTNLMTAIFGITRNVAGDNDIVIVDTSGTPVVVARGLLLPWGYRAYTTIKIVVDPVTGVYERFLINNLSFDTSKTAANVVPTPFSPLIWIILGETGTPTNTSTFYHNGFIVTQNEPAND